jgi:hypothetical protein
MQAFARLSAAAASRRGKKASLKWVECASSRRRVTVFDADVCFRLSLFSAVISGVSGAVARPCYRTWRGKAHAAPLSSQEPPKGRKRDTVPKKERKARIEEFVEMYVALSYLSTIRLFYLGYFS